jgi:hypothetical protein
MKADPSLVLLGSWADQIDAHGKPLGSLQPATDDAALRGVMATTNPFIHSTIMLRSAIARELGGFRAAFEAAEDDDLWLRMAERGRIANLAEPLIAYRLHGDNVTARKAARQLFSARLARLSARARRRGDTDPAAALQGPPDWDARDVDGSFFANEARAFRLIALADPDIARRADRAMSDLIGLQHIELNHRERKLAQIALVNSLDQEGWSSPRGFAMLAKLIALHPPRALQMLLRRITRRRPAR